MEPTIGRIVHYQVGDGDVMLSSRKTLPAIIITPGGGPGSGPCDALWVAELRIFSETGDVCRQNVPQAKEPTPGHWNWPPNEA